MNKLKRIFPIVGIGASAGGLEAFTKFLANIPEDPQMAFVFVQHLAPNFPSQLTSILSKTTNIPVSEIKNGMTIEPNHVYVTPPNVNVELNGDIFKLSPRGDSQAPHLPINLLFRSLAEQKNRAIGVILSGTGSDGTVGVAEIKASGGITFAQNEKSAEYQLMPRNAVESGSIDFIMPPEEIARELVNIVRHPYLCNKATADEDSRIPEQENDFHKILSLLRTTTGIDFTNYKDTTIKRRIMRRMTLHAKQTLAEYLTYMENNHQEIELLHHDLLINVTSFFRDPEIFEAIKNKVLPEITKNNPSIIRMWAPGCSTGQEAYSLAMLLIEYFDHKPSPPTIQIFGTDINDPKCIEKARLGLYTESIETEVSESRLRRFFTKETGGYRINKFIREMCIFAKQNVMADPPFSRVDVITCRNLLIYLSNPLQQRVLKTFHYALNPNGFLVLGNSETVGIHSNLFNVLDKKLNIYTKKLIALRPETYFYMDKNTKNYVLSSPANSQRVPTTADFQKEADRIIVGRYSPSGVLINENLEILQFRGKTNLYLEPPTGEAVFHILRMAKENLALELGTAIREAKETHVTVNRPNIKFKDGSKEHVAHLEIIPVKLPETNESCFLILFEASKPVDIEAPVSQEKNQTPNEQKKEIIQLRRDLTAAREYLQSIIEQQDAANEEILSSNEELQSTNEELETSKEELQSANEELTTINEELQTQSREINLLNNDLTNLLNGTKIPIIMIGNDLKIRRFNEAASQILQFLPNELNRPLNDLHAIKAINLNRILLDVIHKVIVKEQEIQTSDGQWFMLRVLPNKTADNKIEGAILTLNDIEGIKRTNLHLQEMNDFCRAMVQTARENLVVLDKDLRVKIANHSFYKTFEVLEKETEGKCFYNLGNGQWDIAELRTLLEEILPQKQRIDNYEIEHNFQNLGHRIMLLNATRLEQKQGKDALILIGIEDVTKHRQSLNRFRNDAVELKRSNTDLEQFAFMASHDLKEPLNVVSSYLQLLEKKYVGKVLDEKAKEFISHINSSVSHMQELISKLLEFCQIEQVKTPLKEVDCKQCLKQVLTNLQIKIKKTGAKITFDKLPVVLGNKTQLIQLFQNLISNALKYKSNTTPLINVSAVRQDQEWLISITDNGIGIKPEDLNKIFDIFNRLHGQEYSGIGIGLAICRKIVERHGGKMIVTSEYGKGSVFSFTLPCLTASKS